MSFSVFAINVYFNSTELHRFDEMKKKLFARFLGGLPGAIAPLEEFVKCRARPHLSGSMHQEGFCVKLWQVGENEEQGL